MLAYIVGSVDTYSAAVLIAIAVTLCIIITTAIGKRRGKRELEMQFEVDKQKLRNEDMQNQRVNDRAREFELAKIASERDVQFKRIDTGLIEATKN